MALVHTLCVGKCNNISFNNATFFSCLLFCKREVLKQALAEISHTVKEQNREMRRTQEGGVSVNPCIDFH